MGQALKVIKFNSDEHVEGDQNSQKQKSSKFSAILMPLGIAAIFTAILGVFSLVLEVKLYFQFRYEIYLARLFPTIFSLITLLALQTVFGKRNHKLLTHIYLFSILSSISFVASKLPNLFAYNILGASLFVLVLSMYLSWDKINQSITVFYFLILFGISAFSTNIFSNPESNIVLYFSTSISILLISILAIKGSKTKRTNNNQQEILTQEMNVSDEDLDLFRLMVEESVIPIFRIKLDGEFCFGNNPLLEMLAITNQEELKTTNFFNDIINNEKVKNHFLKKIENKRKVENYRFTFRKKDATEEVLLLDCRSRLHDEQVYLEGSLRNITYQFRKDKILRNELEVLRQSKRQKSKIIPNVQENSKKSNVLSRMGHELRTPMNSVLGFLTLIENGLFENENELKEFSHSAKLSAESLLGLINDVVEISKIQDGSAEVVKGEFTLRIEIDKLIDTLEPHLDQKQLQLEIEIDDNIPEKVILDQQKYILILTNLLRNAITVTEEGVIKLNVKSEKDEKGWLKLVTEVIDSGPGNTDEELDNMINYDINSKNENSNITASILHIMISRELTNILEGNLKGVSKLGEGSTFHFAIDLQSTLKDNSDDSFGELPFKVDSNTKARLLLVEDNPISRKVEQKLLQEAGYDVTCVESGADAIIHVEQGGYNLVLMDIELKDMNGLETTKLIRQLPEAVKDVPIIAVTAHSSMKDREKCLLAGMNDYISKPINITFLKMTIDQWLQQVRTN